MPGGECITVAHLDVECGVQFADPDDYSRRKLRRQRLAAESPGRRVHLDDLHCLFFSISDLAGEASSKITRCDA